MKNIDRIQFANLIDESVWYAKKKHAEIVYRKCIEAHKYKFAVKIALRYGLKDENKNHDSELALGMALLATKI